ncbi:MAG: radical SAM protein, partial [Planctomycetota bacterium]
AGHEVELLDSGASRKARRVPIPDMMKEMVPCSDAEDSSPFKLFGRFYHYGPRFFEIKELIRRSNPDAIGIAALFSAYGKEALACAEAARQAAPNATVIMGGGHASFAPGQILRLNFADFCITGEGEHALPELLEAVAQGRDPSLIPGVCGLRQDRSLFRNQPCQVSDIDSLPMPARQLLDLDAYRFQGRRLALILSSRGCPFRCAFCSAHLTSGNIFRPRNPERVVEEMLECRDRFDIRAFDFEDDNLVVDTERAECLMHLIIDAFGEENLRLEAMNGISSKGLNPSLLRLMKRAGFSRLNISPLSSTPGLRSSMRRPERLDEVASLPGQAEKLGFDLTAYLMIGYPGQHLTEIMDDLCLWAEKPVLLAPSVFYPAPGSPVQLELFPYLDDADAERWALTRSSLFPETPEGLSRKELRTVFWMVRMANFARSLVPERDTGRLRELCFHLIDMAEKAPVDSARDRGKGARRLSTRFALDTVSRGKVALAYYLKTTIPYGIQRIQRGDAGREWVYRVFPLDAMIGDPRFYTDYGIPGFAGVFPKETPHKRV